MKKTSIFILIAVFFTALLAGFFVYPRAEIFGVGISPLDFGARFLPWRLGLDLVGGAHLIYEVDMSKVAAGDRGAVMSGLRDVIEKRVNKFGVSEPRVESAKSGDSYRVVAELAGIKDVSQAVREIGLTPFLDFREVEEAENGGGAPVFKETALTGRYITGAQVDFDPNTFVPQVNLQFNDEGAEIFESLTEKNVGRPLAIFLDSELISMPVVREKIGGGRAQITGDFTADEAKRLAERFNAGALPAPISLVSQQVVGASLGEDSLKKAVLAGLWGTAAVALFMIFYYRWLGFFSAIALFVYIVLVLAALKGLAVTLTLAGVAGVILSVGMAVDANVLIFERTKEELKKGLRKAAAIEEGFRRAWPSIRDSNITTVISSIILYYFTSSFVKGFALALLVGVLISMFSAITVTRALLRTFVGK